MKRGRGTVRAVVFDLDDTLYPEIEYVRSGFRAVAEYLGERGHAKDTVLTRLQREFEADPRTRVFNRVLEQLGEVADEQMVGTLVKVYREHRPALKLGTDVGEILEQLRKTYKLGLLTDGFLPAQKLKVAALGLEGKFDHIIYTEELGREFWKPARKGFELMAAALGCGGEECVYVADNAAKDFVAPNELGWDTVQISLPEGIHAAEAAPAGGEPQGTIYRIGKLVEYLRD
jgi:putative hydrolase of the HAD superfamily